MEIILGVLGLLTGSSVTTFVLTLLQRHWKKNDSLEEIKTQLAAHCKADDERYIKQCRTRILRFNDEVIRGMHHTEEHFNDVMEDITEYNRYCDEHRDFKNEKAVMAIANIQRVYKICMEEDSFLRAE